MAKNNFPPTELAPELFFGESRDTLLTPGEEMIHPLNSSWSKTKMLCTRRLKSRSLMLSGAAVFLWPLSAMTHVLSRSKRIYIIILNYQRFIGMKKVSVVLVCYRR